MENNIQIEFDNFVYQIVDKNGERQAWLQKYTDCNVTKVVIPDCICYEEVRVPITLIEKECFSACRQLASITLPSTLKYLGNSCFDCCFDLKEIELPYLLEIIGYDCFRGSGLTKVSIPSSVRYIGTNAFRGCPALTEIQIYGSNTEFGPYCFAECGSLNEILFAYEDVCIYENCVYGCNFLSEESRKHIKKREKSKVEIFYLRYEHFIDKLSHSRFVRGCNNIISKDNILGMICFLIILIILFIPAMIGLIAYPLGLFVLDYVERKFAFHHNNESAYVIACWVIGLPLYILLTIIVGFLVIITDFRII